MDVDSDGLRSTDSIKYGTAVSDKTIRSVLRGALLYPKNDLGLQVDVLVQLVYEYARFSHYRSVIVTQWFRGIEYRAARTNVGILPCGPEGSDALFGCDREKGMLWRVGLTHEMSPYGAIGKQLNPLAICVHPFLPNTHCIVSTTGHDPLLLILNITEKTHEVYGGDDAHRVESADTTMDKSGWISPVSMCVANNRKSIYVCDWGSVHAFRRIDIVGDRCSRDDRVYTYDYRDLRGLVKVVCSAFESTATVDTLYILGGTKPTAQTATIFRHSTDSPLRTVLHTPYFISDLNCLRNGLLVITSAKGVHVVDPVSSPVRTAVLSDLTTNDSIDRYTTSAVDSREHYLYLHDSGGVLRRLALPDLYF